MRRRRVVPQTPAPWARSGALAGLCLAALAACAAPRVTGPPPAERLESFALVRDEPAVAAATTALAGAAPATRPAALMVRARAAIAVAQRQRGAQPVVFFVPGGENGYPRFLACYELAARDLDEILESHAASPEAAEALYTEGLIRDYPHLERFDEALAAYRATIERYPGSAWAGRARERIRALEGIMPAAGPHGGLAPAR